MSVAWSKNLVLSSNTMGSSLAAYHLVDMLNQDVIPTYEKHRLLSFFNKTMIGLKKLLKIEDPAFRAYIVNMWKERQFKLIDSQNWDTKVKSYFKNVITSSCKESLQ